VFDSTGDGAVAYRLDGGPGGAGEAVGSTGRAGLASFLAFAERAGAWDALGARVRLPVQERRTGFTQRQKHQAVVGALAAGCKRARDGDFVLKPDPVAAAALGLSRWPHSSQLTRHLRAFRPQHVRALRGAVEEVTAARARARGRLRRGEPVVVGVDRSPISANGRTYQGAERGRLKTKGERGYQATVAFAGDTGGGQDAVLAAFLEGGNAHATWRLADVLAALERVLGRPEALPGLVLRFDCQYATGDDLALLLGRRIRFVGRAFSEATAAAWAREVGPEARWVELSPVKWVCELGGGPAAATRPDVRCRRVLVRSTGARHRAGYTALLTTIPATELDAAALEAFYEARQTIEGWFSEATAALPLKGLWSRSFCGLEAFLLLAALTSNLLNWWARRQLLPGSGLPPLGLRQLLARVVALPARVLRAPDGRLLLLLPPQHPYARRLVRDGPGWQPPLPLPVAA
jgi:hypothetical protein